MTTRDFTTSFTVDQSPDEVFRAINDARGWWSAGIEGETDRLGGQFDYRYKDMHTSTHRITEYVPGRKVVWDVPRASINFVKDKSEWTGTRIVFDIARKDGKTELRFTHVGLVPALQ